MKFNFNISLSVLNHLGRNLYRNFITVIGEAISNSWDADAENVFITINRERKIMSIVDDGIGMNEKDFQNKFLKIGYSKRNEGIVRTIKNRPFIGRKGIGKLALLSCAKEIEIASFKEGENIIGGLINNALLDKAIKDDINSHEYTLDEKIEEAKQLLLNNNINHGTAILFRDFSDGINNTIEYIKKAIALNFRFSLLDKKFKIYMNNSLIDEKELRDLAKNSQFLWIINGYDDPYLKLSEFQNNLLKKTNISSKLPIKGFISTVEKPSQLKIRNTDYFVTLDLIVNGRLREKDLLKYKPTARVVENYSYGQVFYDDLDKGIGEDLFTSSREGVISDSKIYNDFLSELNHIYSKILSDWDKFRLEHNQDGDSDNKKIPPKERKAQELFSKIIEDMNLSNKKNHEISDWIKNLYEESKFNFPSYSECFIIENLLRKFITSKSISISNEILSNAKKYKKKEDENKNKLKIEYDIRKNNDLLYYLNLWDLNGIVESTKEYKLLLDNEAIIYKVVRNPIAHTSIVTNEAKKELNSIFKKIESELNKILDSVDSNKKTK